MSTDPVSEKSAASVLMVDGDVIARHAIGDYLRQCGYSVVEAATVDEAYIALVEASLSIDIILCEVSALGPQSGFELATWVRANRPELEVKLVGGEEKAAETAADLCESGPHLARPYEPEALVDYIKRLRAGRHSSG